MQDTQTTNYVCQYCGTATDARGRDYYGDAVCKAWQTVLHVVYRRV